MVLASSHGIAQQPSPIPNWTPSAPGTSAQYNPNQDSPSQAYGYARQPYDQAQTEQPPAYEQPPDYPHQYGQPQYQQAPDNQQYSYQQAPDLNSEQAWGVPDQGLALSYQPQQALSPDRLEQMVAPIALYPDNLVSMILAASTYPAEISSADQWLHMQGGASPEQIAAGANAQASWDPSVKALTAFPQVLDTLAQNLQWTTDLGNAYYNQPQDVMQTIQVMRGRAQAAGNLQDTPQQEVIVDQGEIQIAPPTPEVVYVPQYNPWAVYGQPVNPYPGFSWVGGVTDAFIDWGPGVFLNAFASVPFGWLGWGLDWSSHAIYYGNDVWCPRGYAGRDWGFAHGGARYWGYHGEMARWRERGGWGGRGGRGDWGGHGGWQGHTFRSGLDRGRHGNGGSWGSNGGSGWGREGNRGGYGGREGGSWGRNGGGQGHGGNWGRNGNGGGYGGQDGDSWSRNGGGGGNGGNRDRNGGGYGGHNGNGQNGGFGRGGYGVPNGGAFAYGGAEGRVPTGRGLGFSATPNGGYGQPGRNSQGWQAYNRAPQAIGRPQQNGGAQSFGQGRQGYGYPAPQHVYGGNYGRQYGGGSSGIYNSRPGFGGQQYRSPSSGYNYGGHSYNYGGSSGIARSPSNGGGFHLFGGGGRSSNSYGGGSFKAPKAPSYSNHSWGGGGSHFSGGSNHSWGGGGSHFSGGGSHFGGGGGHFGGGGGHSGGGHSSSGHGGGGHGGGHHH